MRYGRRQFNRRTRARLHRATGALALAVWLTMAFAEMCPSFHAWLHGGTIPDDDNCAVVAIAHGKVETTPIDVPAVLPVTWIEIAPRVEFSVFVPIYKNLSPGRDPPALPVVS
ncbi:MAG TPA: hypothetical protein VMD27_10785 [Candidatus Aquilonibacter sp.]|nr:hypothetical protein [Candidatus Aquilonibacter sp.]